MFSNFILICQIFYGKMKIENDFSCKIRSVRCDVDPAYAALVALISKRDIDIDIDIIFTISFVSNELR